MTVQSRLHEGTTVTVALPLTFTPPAAQALSNIATLMPVPRSPAQDKDPDKDQTHQVKKSA
jgi:cell cycle sensor histidine kinase DivJ